MNSENWKLLSSWEPWRKLYLGDFCNGPWNGGLHENLSKGE